MGVASFEATLELWASSLREAKARMRPLFSQERMARSAGVFLDGLLGPERRKTGWMRAEAAGDAGPWRQQAILGRGRWEADGLRDVAREYALETLADGNAVLVVDETGFLKQGKASCGVARQYTGSAGKITNCQIGVFLAYVSRHGHAFIDRALYLPKAWTDDPAGRAATHVPPELGFATKPRIALRMIERAIAAGVPFSWVAADTVYGVGAVEMALRRAGKGYVLGVTGSHHVRSWGVLPAIAGTAEEAPRRTSPHRRGGASRRARARRGRACTTGSISNSPTSRRTSMSRASPASGRVDCWSGGTSRMANSPTSARGVPKARPLRPSSASRATAGPSRTRSRRRRTNSALTTTRPVPGTAGTATSRSRCSPSLSSPPRATGRTRQPSKPRRA